MLNTYGNTDKCLPLSPQSCSRSPRSLCGRLPFLPLGTEWEERERGEGIHFWIIIDSTARYVSPPEGTLMIPSPNDICLRPIRTAHPDIVSTGIMSGWISSAPVRWAADKFGKWDRWNYIASMTPCVIKCRMKPGTNRVSRILSDFRAAELCQASGAAGEPRWAISCLGKLQFCFWCESSLAREKL